MEPESPLPHSQVPATCPYPEQDLSSFPHPTSGRFILILSSHLRLGLPSGLFPPRIPTKTLYTPLITPIRVTCPVQLILIDLITRKILGEEYRLCSFPNSPVTSSLLGPNILLSTLFSNTLNLRPPSARATKFHTHTKQQEKLQFNCNNYRL